MKGVSCRLLLPSLGLLVALLLSGCAAPKPVIVPPPEAAAPRKSMIVLLPEGDKVSGEVTVTNANGSEVLNQSWQAVEIAGIQDGPGKPVVLQDAAVQDQFGAVLAATPAPPVHYLLYFKVNCAELLPESRLLLPEIARVVQERSPAALSIVGHTDSVGSVKYNYGLGLKRAAAVAELLAREGAAPASVETSSRGKSDLKVKTPDQTPEPRNRRAEVSIR